MLSIEPYWNDGRKIENPVPIRIETGDSTLTHVRHNYVCYSERYRWFTVYISVAFRQKTMFG